VGFKVTGIKFMTAFIVRKDAACFLAWVTTILPLYLPGKCIFYKYTPFAVLVGPCHHGMARPQVADRGTASDKEGSCE
jgi:hypothetical protein